MTSFPFIDRHGRAILVMSHSDRGLTLVVRRYVPTERLAYEYPDESYVCLGDAQSLGADGTPLAHEDSLEAIPASDRFLRAATAADHY